MDLTKQLLGGFHPSSTPSTDRIASFLQVNIPFVMHAVLPAAGVRVMKDQTAYQDPVLRQDMILSYVWTDAEGRPDYTSTQVEGGFHTFIFRPENYRLMARLMGFDEKLNEPTLMSLWNFIGYSVRRCLQKTCMSELVLLTKADLVALGVEAGLIAGTEAFMTGTATASGMCGMVKDLYFDAGWIGLLVSHRIAEHIIAKKPPFRPSDIAGWIRYKPVRA